MSAPKFVCLAWPTWNLSLCVPIAAKVLSTDQPSHRDGSLRTFSSKTVFRTITANAVLPVPASTGTLDSSLA